MSTRTTKEGIRSAGRVLLVAAAVATTAATLAVRCDAVSAQASTTLAISNVTVVPMDGNRVLPAQTVIVRGDRIEAIAPAATTTIPAGATVIDGRGRFLMPGLVDMHIHAVNGTGVEGDAAWQQMMLLVANGVTTARSLAGAPTAPQLRDAIRAGKLVGPRLYLAGPSLNQQSVTTPDVARTVVRAQAAQGFNFLKTHGVQRDVYDAIVETAKEVGIRLVGHVTPQVGLDVALAVRQQIEHLDGYLLATMPADAPGRSTPGQLYSGPELDVMNEAAMPELARRTVAAGVWNAPTLALFEIVAAPQPAAHYLAWPEMKYAPQQARTAWTNQITNLGAAPVTPARRERFLQLRQAMTRALRDAGAGLLAGSDSPQFFMLPGFALHREMRALQNAGLTPYEALAAATVNPASYIANDADFGVVATGRSADLLLLNANPLEDVANTQAIHGVVLRGEWLPAEKLEAMKSAVAQAVAGG